MIPIRDSIPNVHRPLAVWGLIVLNSLVFLYELSQSQQGLFRVFTNYGIIPATYFSDQWGGPAFVPSNLLPFVSYMFLHSGWVHFLMNMWVLWIFADNVEDVMGTLPFLVFYLLCGFGAAGLHVAFNQSSMIPVIGASGAIAGVMGAYLILYPHGRVVTFIPIFFLPWIIEVPSVLFLGIWFATQIFSGFATYLSGQEGGVAWWAHAGGFVIGILLLPFFRDKSRCYYCYEKSSKRYQRR